MRSAQATVASQKRTVEATRSALKEAEASALRERGVLKAAQNRLRLLGVTPGGGSQVTITAPIGGEVEKRPINAGEVVTVGQTLAAILNTETVWVESDVYEKDLSRVRVGQRVTIAADAVPGRTFAGTISYIGGEVNPETRAVRVRTVVANPGERLKPNMFVRVAIASSGAESAVTVPQEAVQEDGAEQVVFIAEGEGAYRRRVVRIGPTLGDQVVILSGMLPGEKVVTKGAYQLLAKAKQG
jgi:RND family efflux transporter MFP subunit